jgi:IS5 family transposase
MSRLLDANRLALKAVHADLLRIRMADAKRGRKGMSAEQVVRIAIVKQMLSLSYDELAFRLGDSLQLRAFCRLSAADDTPAKSTLQANIGAIRAESWEGMNKSLMKDARTRKVEDGRWMRTDSTVVESNIRIPCTSPRSRRSRGRDADSRA